MAATKYNDSTIEIILKTIAETNSESAAWNAAGISSRTYYAWKKKYEDFAFKIQEARFQFLEQNRMVFRVLALNDLYEALTRGVVQTRTTTVEELVEVKRDEPGASKLELTTTKRTTVRTELGKPQWAVERVLGRNTDEFDAVNRLIEAGWFDSKLVSELPSEIDEFNDRVREILTRNAIK